MEHSGRRPGKAKRAGKVQPKATAKPAAKPMPAKTVWKPGNLVMPVPAALASCALPGEKPNLITLAWTGNVNSEPAMLFISIRPSRHSYDIVKDTGEFVLNIPSASQSREVDYCGVVSGRDVDKFAETGFTPIAVQGVSCPAVAECPVNISCKVVDSKLLGSHEMFLARIEAVTVSSALIDRTGKFRIEKTDALAYAHGTYFSLGKVLGTFGYSVRKKKPRRRASSK